MYEKGVGIYNYDMPIENFKIKTVMLTSFVSVTEMLSFYNLKNILSSPISNMFLLITFKLLKHVPISITNLI